MSFISILDSLGADVKAFWKAAEPIISDVDTLAKDLEPEVAIALPAYSALFDNVVDWIAEAESAASANGLVKAGKVKMSYVVDKAAPYVVANAAKLKIKQPTVAQLKAYIQGQVDSLKAFEAL
jgi:hypothetical protein